MVANDPGATTHEPILVWCLVCSYTIIPVFRETRAQRLRCACQGIHETCVRSLDPEILCLRQYKQGLLHTWLVYAFVSMFCAVQNKLAMTFQVFLSGGLNEWNILLHSIKPQLGKASYLCFFSAKGRPKIRLMTVSSTVCSFQTSWWMKHRSVQETRAQKY